MGGHDNIPCRVSADLRAYQAEQDRNEISEEEMDSLKERAKEEIMDAIMSKPNGFRGRVHLGYVIEGYLNEGDSAEYRWRLEKIGGLFLDIFNGKAEDRDVPMADRLILARGDAELFLRGLAEKYIEGDIVDDYAEELASDSED